MTLHTVNLSEQYHNQCLLCETEQEFYDPFNQINQLFQGYLHNTPFGFILGLFEQKYIVCSLKKRKTNQLAEYG